MQEIIIYVYKENFNWEIVYRTYAKEVIEIAIKNPFILLGTVEKSLRSAISYPPKLPSTPSIHIGKEANSIERERLNINNLLIKNETVKKITANKREPLKHILISSLKLFGKLLLPSKCFLQLFTSDSDKRK